MLQRQKIEPNRLPEVLVAKWGSAVLCEGFTPLPKRLLRCLPLVFRGQHALEHLAVILAVVDYRRPNLQRPPSVDFLAFIAGMPPKRLKKRLGELKTKGWITMDGTDDALDVNIEPFFKVILDSDSDE